MLAATPQRTALRRPTADAHDARADDVGGADRHAEREAAKMMVAAVVSAAKPWIGSSFTTSCPSSG